MPNNYTDYFRKLCPPWYLYSHKMEVPEEYYDDMHKRIISVYNFLQVRYPHREAKTTTWVNLKDGEAPFFFQVPRMVGFLYSIPSLQEKIDLINLISLYFTVPSETLDMTAQKYGYKYKGISMRSPLRYPFEELYFLFMEDVYNTTYDLHCITVKGVSREEEAQGVLAVNQDMKTPLKSNDVAVLIEKVPDRAPQRMPRE